VELAPIVTRLESGINFKLFGDICAIRRGFSFIISKISYSKEYTKLSKE